MGITISINDNVLETLGQLPKKSQKSTLEFIKKFKQNPKSLGINIEGIKGAKNKNLRSARITLEIRAIIYESGNAYSLLYVGQHDDAYKWARTINVDKINGELVITVGLDINNEEQEGEILHPLFGGISKRYLIAMGIDDDQIETVKNIKSKREFDEFKAKLPTDVADNLEFVLAGVPIDEIIEYYKKTQESVPEAPITNEELRDEIGKLVDGFADNGVKVIMVQPEVKFSTVVLSVKKVAGALIDSYWKYPMQYVKTDSGAFIENAVVGGYSRGYNWESEVGNTVNVRIIKDSNGHEWIKKV